MQVPLKLQTEGSLYPLKAFLHKLTRKPGERGRNPRKLFFCWHRSWGKEGTVLGPDFWDSATTRNGLNLQETTPTLPLAPRLKSRVFLRVRLNSWEGRQQNILSEFGNLDSLGCCALYVVSCSHSMVMAELGMLCVLPLLLAFGVLFKSKSRYL